MKSESMITFAASAKALAVAGYAARYRQPSVRPDRVAIEILVDNVMGRA